MLICSLLLVTTIIFKNSMQDGKIPSDEILESLYKLRIRESAQLKTVLELYDMEIHQKISMPNYQKLKTIVKRRKEQKLRLQNFDAKHGRIETGAVVMNRKGMSGVEGGKSTCYQWKEKDQCSKGDQCSVRYESNDRAQKPEHNAATPSEPSLSRGRSVSKKRSIQCKSNHGAILARDRLVNIGILPSVNFSKQKRAAKLGISICSRIIELMNNQTKSQRKGYYSHKRRASDDKNAVAIVKIVPQLGCVSKNSVRWFLKEANSPGETRCKKSWDLLEKYDSLGLRYIKQVSGKRKDHRLEKYKSNLLISEVPTL